MIPSSVFTKELYNTLPQGWIEKRLKFVSHILPSNVDKKNYEDQKTVQLCNYVDVYYNDSIDSSLNFMTSTASDQEINKFTLRTGDVIITKDSESPNDIGIPSVVRENIDDLICGYHLTVLKPKNEIYGYFLFWYIYSKLSSSFFEKRANGITRFAIGMNTISSLPVIFPSLELQTQIADFLDKETTRIDTLITKKQKQIELLNEKRQAIITQSVTKGLDENVKMKDSGVEWIGEIPEHWELKRLRFLMETNPPKSKCKILDYTTEVSFIPMELIGEKGELDVSIKKPIEEVYNGYTFFEEGDVVFAKITPCFENGKGAITKNLFNKTGFGTTELHVLRSNKNELNNEYLYLVTTSYFFRKIGESTMYGAGGQKRVPENFVKDFLLPLPSISEQKEILILVQDELKRLDELDNKIIKSIDLLKEYRSSLITHAVSGQIDISKYEVSK